MQALIKQDLILAGHDVASGGLITTLLEMCFADVNLAADLDLSALKENDAVKLLFNENCGIVFQAANSSVEKLFDDSNIEYFKIGTVTEGETLSIKNQNQSFNFNIPQLRDTWFKTSFLLDKKQSGTDMATQRYQNYKNQPLTFKFPEDFDGKLPVIDSSKPRIKAAVIREKGSNSEREMARAMHLAGFDVKDVHMTDLISGRETLEGIKFIAAVGGFSNSDVLGSAKGWAGAFLYNEKAKTALDNFFAREDTLSIGVCNGCQLFIELGLINPDHDEKPKMLHNKSKKFECTFTSVEIKENRSVMLGSLAGSKLGIWAAHGEGKFSFPYSKERYNIVGEYGFDKYPSNPNGSNLNTAMLTDDTGRHLVMMPHLERSTFQWNWAYYPKGRKDEVSPWLEAFVNARKWLEEKI
jgi:phosphoribosylformylglycinamidine synthase